MAFGIFREDKSFQLFPQLIYNFFEKSLKRAYDVITSMEKSSQTESLRFVRSMINLNNSLTLQLQYNLSSLDLEISYQKRDQISPGGGKNILHRIPDYNSYISSWILVFVVIAKTVA